MYGVLAQCSLLKVATLSVAAKASIPTSMKMDLNLFVFEKACPPKEELVKNVERVGAQPQNLKTQLLDEAEALMSGAPKMIHRTSSELQLIIENCKLLALAFKRQGQMKDALKLHRL